MLEETVDFDDYQAMLRDLIGKGYAHYKELDKIEIKIGELIKMIELSKKLEPGDTSQKEFWQMLEQIRQKKLSEQKQAKPTVKKEGGIKKK